MNSSETASPSPNLLAGYIPEETLAEARGVTIRTLRAERQRGDGPSYVTINRGAYLTRQPGGALWHRRRGP